MRKTFRKFWQAVQSKRLTEPFRVGEAKMATGISWAGNFLAKHRVGNPGDETELFVRVGTVPVRYRINRA
jgi:hypothetical protein